MDRVKSEERDYQGNQRLSDLPNLDTHSAPTRNKTSVTRKRTRTSLMVEQRRQGRKEIRK